MHRMIPIFLLVVITTVTSCSKASPTTNSMALGFKSTFTIQWPGQQEESFQIMPGKTGEVKYFNAGFTESKFDKETGTALHDGSATIYDVTVYEYPPKSLDDEKMTPQDILNASRVVKQAEISFKEIQHGPRKYPGHDIYKKTDKSFSRILTVMAENRLYFVSVTSKKEENLKSPQVETFFESFTIKE